MSSRWNRPMRSCRAEPAPEPECVPTIHPKTRARILATVRTCGPIHAPAVAQRTGYTLNTVWRVLMQLEREGAATVSADEWVTLWSVTR